MRIFDKYIKRALELTVREGAAPLDASGVQAWPLVARTPFLMERDAAIELGGYPRESLNLILSTSSIYDDNDGIWVLGNRDLLMGNEKHVSFGKIVLLTTAEIPEDRIYDYTQQVKLADSRLRFADVMVRTSPEQFLTNLRVSKSAMASGFNLERMGRAIHEHFMEIPQVHAVKVILLAGESGIYKELLPAAEDVKNITAALNTMFDGIDMDCGSCAMSPICDEVEDLRRLHKEAKNNKLKGER